MNKGLSDYTGLGTNSFVNINAVRSGKPGGKSDPKWMIHCNAVGCKNNHNPEAHKNFVEARDARKSKREKKNADKSTSNIKAVKTTTDTAVTQVDCDTQNNK